MGAVKGKRSRGISVSAGVFTGQGRERTEKGFGMGEKKIDGRVSKGLWCICFGAVMLEG